MCSTSTINFKTLTLKRHEFDEFSSQTFKSYYRDTTISDVTIVCNDIKLIKAHKLILSSSSQVIKNLIKNSTGPSYVLKIDVSFHNMDLLIEYIYTGECEVESIQLSGFLKDVEYLHVNGLNQNDTSAENNGKIIVRNHESKSLSLSAFRSCYKDTTLSDITIMCKGNELVKAHKFVLASSSAVLEDLIISGSSHVIKLDISLQNLEIMLELLYTSEFKVKLQSLHQLQKDINDLQIEGIYIDNKKLDSELNLQPKTLSSSHVEEGKSIKIESYFIDPSGYDNHSVYKGWEPTFLIGAFGLSEELSTKVGFAFSNNCLKSQDLGFRIEI